MKNTALDKVETAETTGVVTGRLAGKYLTFTLHNESFGIEVLKVREIIRHTHYTPIPQMPAHVRGVINLRGKIIPVIDLRLRFDFPAAAETETSCIIVVHTKACSDSYKAMGLIVDGVEDVVNVAAEDIEERPDFGGVAATSYVLGMAKIKGKVKTLLDVDTVVPRTRPLVSEI